MSQLLYSLVLKPVSRLPLSATYYLSDFMFMIIYRLIGFRKKVVLENLQNAFPDMTETEIRRLAKDFYRHFCDLIIESIRMFSMPEAEVLRRCRALNHEMLEAIYRQGKSVLIVAGHFGNWELAALSLGLQISHQPVGIYHPLSDKFFDDKFRQSRSRFGMGLVAKNDTKKFFEEGKSQLSAVMFGSDQSPHNVRKAYWTYFLNQETAVMFGTEKYAKEYDYPVVFGRLRKVRRGYYEMSFELITDRPRETPYGYISERFTRMLEEQILEQPPFWLWTHRRWKRERPEDVPIGGDPNRRVRVVKGS